MSITRKPDPASPHYLHCHTLDELTAYLHNQVDAEKRAEIYYHLNQERCNRCRKLYEVARELKPVSEQDDSLPEIQLVDFARLDWLKQKGRQSFTPPPVPSRLENGQVWITSCEVRDAHGELDYKVDYAYPVMIVDPGNGELSFNNMIRVVPLSVDTDFSWPGHSLLLPRNNPLGYSCLLEIFNERPMLAGNLKSFCGNCGSEDLQRFEQERRIWLMEDFNTPDAEIRDWENRELELADYLSAPANEMLWDGEEVEEFSPAIADNSEDLLPVREIFQPVELTDYALAAATDETDDVLLSDIHIYPLYTDDELDVVLFQERDQVTLIITLAGSEPWNFTVNGEDKDLEKLEPDQYFFTLSSEIIMSDSVQLSFVVNQHPYSFTVQLSRFHHPDKPE